MHIFNRAACALLVLLTLPLPLLSQQEGPTEVPVSVAVEARVAEIERTGRFALNFAIEVQGDIAANYRLMVSVRAGGREFLDRSHVPLKSSSTWKKGDLVQYELPTMFPIERAPRDAETVEFFVCFQDPRTRKLLPPAGGDTRSPFTLAGFMPAPTFSGLEDDASTQALIEEGIALIKSGKRMEAWEALEFVMRRAEEDRWKRSCLQAMLSIKKLSPRQVNAIESQIIKKRIADEKTRYLRQQAGRLFDRKRYHASLAILESIGGTLAEAGDAAVMGDLNGAERRERSKQETKRMILERIAPDALSQARKEASKFNGEALLKRAQFHIDKKNFPVARFLLREMRLEDDAELRGRAYKKLEEVQDAMIKAIPEEEKAMVRAAVEHPCWARTTTRVTQNFILIGPTTLLQGISDESALRFDIAYVLITDLFGRRPNPEGDRVTVYFKELWDFGGGTGGGKQINIGRADPTRRNQRLDTGLFYHEFTHCVDDTTPIIAGWREGLADFGAVYAFDLIGQNREATQRFKSYRDAFKADYLDRDLEFWRIPNYAPSAGFFTHFVEQAAKKRKGKKDWRPYREFFRAYRDISLRDGREQALVRGVAFVMMSVFGDWVFDDLMRFRFPLVASDKEIIKKEYQAHDSGVYEDFEDVDAHEKWPNSPLPRDMVFRVLMEMAGRRSNNADEVATMAAEELGVIFDWKVIGPFKGDGMDPGAQIFPPEYDQDFSKKYTSGANVCVWSEPTVDGPVIQRDYGWLDFKYNYMDNTAIYALSHVSVPKEMDVLVHVRADDDLTLFINDELVGKYHGRGNNGSTRSRWRGPHTALPDALRFSAKLSKGRNKVLVKVKNGHGASGMICAITQPNGVAIPLLMSDDQPSAASEIASPDVKWKKPVKLRFTSRSSARQFDRTVGKLDIKKKRLVGADTSRGVAWRKYTVRPGFPKDSPSNLFWMKNKNTRGMRNFKLAIELEHDKGRSPKLGICFDGDGGRDGLGGLTLVIHPAGKGRIRGRLERYDRLVYGTGPVELSDLPKSGSRLLIVERINNKVTVRIDDKTIFNAVDMRPIANRSRLGFMTWGPDTRLVGIDLRAAR